MWQSHLPMRFGIHCKRTHMFNFFTNYISSSYFFCHSLLRFSFPFFSSMIHVHSLTSFHAKRTFLSPPSLSLSQTHTLTLHTKLTFVLLFGLENNSCPSVSFLKKSCSWVLTMGSLYEIVLFECVLCVNEMEDCVCGEPLGLWMHILKLLCFVCVHWSLVLIRRFACSNLAIWFNSLHKWSQDWIFKPSLKFCLLGSSFFLISWLYYYYYYYISLKV